MKQKISDLLSGHGAHLLILVILLGGGWVHRAFFSSAAMQPALEADMRVVVVDAKGSEPSTFDEHSATLVSGTLERGSYRAVVLSDANCAPDAEGVSHCLNALSVGESVVTIRHHHRMDQVPCLRAGESVTIIKDPDYKETDA